MLTRLGCTEVIQVHTIEFRSGWANRSKLLLSEMLSRWNKTDTIDLRSLSAEETEMMP